jgi:hypothetical protein
MGYGNGSYCGIEFSDVLRGIRFARYACQE